MNSPVYLAPGETEGPLRTATRFRVLHSLRIESPFGDARHGNLAWRRDEAERDVNEPFLYNRSRRTTDQPLKDFKITISSGI